MTESCIEAQVTGPNATVAIPGPREASSFSEPILLRDGRRLYGFRAGAIPERTSARAFELLDEAHWRGAVVVADGAELIVVDRWLSTLPLEMLDAIRYGTGEVIAALIQRSRTRCAEREVASNPETIAP